MKHSIIDPLFGIINSLTRVDFQIPVPPAFSAYVARCTDVSRYQPSWKVDLIGSGCGFDEQSSQLQAIGEAIERYCGNILSNEVHCLTAREAGLVSDFLDPGSFLFYSADLRQRLGKTFATLSEDDPLAWIGGMLHRNGRQSAALIPCEVTHLKNHPRDCGLGRPRFVPMQFAGIAAHSNREIAVANALLEDIERHDTFRWWYGCHAASCADEMDFDGKSVLHESLREHYEIRTAILNEGPYGVTVACGLRWKQTGDFLVGFSCKQSFGQAATKAIAEALQLMELLQGLRDQTSWLWQAWRSGALSEFALELPQSVRRGTGIRHSLLYNLQYYLDAGGFEDALTHWDHVVGKAPINLQGRFLPVTESRLGEISASEKWTIALVDLTSSDVQEAGMHVIRLVVPELVQNTAHDLVPDAHPALRRDNKLVVPPLPHA